MDGAIVAVSPARAKSKVATAKREAPAVSKIDIVLKKLRSAKGVSIQQLSEATGWQLHSVRGFLSATVRKKLGLNLISETGKDEVRRYRVVDAAGPAAS
jgi:predicted transcriptional regulator